MNNGNKFRDKRHYSRPKQKNFTVKKNIYSKWSTKFLGLGLFFLTIFIFLSSISYIFTFQEDQAVVEQCLKNIFSHHNVKIHNWFGLDGASVSYLFVYKFLGFIPSLIFLFPFLILSCAMLGCKYFQRWDIIKIFSLSLLTMFLTNACIGLFLKQEFYSPFAGFLSYYIASLLKKNLGFVAYPLVLTIVFILLVLKFRGVLKRSEKKKNDDEEESLKVDKENEMVPLN